MFLSFLYLKFVKKYLKKDWILSIKSLNITNLSDGKFMKTFTVKTEGAGFKSWKQTWQCWLTSWMKTQRMHIFHQDTVPFGHIFVALYTFFHDKTFESVLDFCHFEATWNGIKSSIFSLFYFKIVFLFITYVF